MDDAIRHRGDAYDAYEMLIKRGEKISPQNSPPTELSSQLVADTKYFTADGLVFTYRQFSTIITD